MSSVEELKLRVAATVAQTQQSMAQLRAVGQQLDETLGLLRLTASGSVHPTLLDAVNKLQAARDRLDEAQLLANAAVNDAQAWRSVA
jgi:hypothetical protein